jgi:hypothetical protein
MAWSDLLVKNQIIEVYVGTNYSFSKIMIYI